MSYVDDTRLRLSDEQELVIDALRVFADRILTGRRSLGRPYVPVLDRMLTTSFSVLSATLPTCPHAPGGASVDLAWDPQTYALIMQCQHSTKDGGPHCWDAQGTPRSC